MKGARVERWEMTMANTEMEWKELERKRSK